MSNTFQAKSGRKLALPAFLPVYQPRERAFQLSTQDPKLDIEGLIVNAYFLYKQKDIRTELVKDTASLHEFVNFDKIIATDSGAFQGFTRQLYLSNKNIVKFQDAIGSDIIAPLDLVTPPGDNRTTAEAKLHATNKRIREALRLAEKGIVAGVQQGGRFEDLRHQSTEALLMMNVEYVAIGSLVPFFNRNHNLIFAGKIVQDTRKMIGDTLPMHIYGSGDPVELPFFFKLGANIFDSASYGHYAKGGYYMTPFGAVKDAGPLLAEEYLCECSVCSAAESPQAVFEDVALLTLHNLWTIHKTIESIRNVQNDPKALDAYLNQILERHQYWFPESDLGPSWEKLHLQA